MSNVMGVDIGGTKCAVVLGEYTEHGEIRLIDREAFPTEVLDGPKKTIDKIVESIEEIWTRNDLSSINIDSIGISCGGPLDSNKGIILSPPNLVGWDHIPIVEILERRLGIKAKLQNDANAGALAEWKFGAAKGYSNVVFLTFGTGLGAGIILNGKLYSGTNGMAGEVGHIRLSEFGPVGYGKSGSFEGFCSGGGIAQLARIKALEKLQAGEKVAFCGSMKDLDAINAKAVGDAALAGDELAREIYRTSGRFLGKGLSIIIDMLNPEIIVIGSIYARCESLLREDAMKVISEECLGHSRDVCNVVPAGLIDRTGDYAALAVAVY